MYIFQHHYEQRLRPSRNLFWEKCCQFVQEVKYLGVIIHSTVKTIVDVARQTRKFYFTLVFEHRVEWRNFLFVVKN